jgi:hypothetical protein
VYIPFASNKNASRKTSKEVPRECNPSVQPTSQQLAQEALGNSEAKIAFWSMLARKLGAFHCIGRT